MGNYVILQSIQISSAEKDLHKVIVPNTLRIPNRYNTLEFQIEREGKINGEASKFGLE